MTVIFFHGLESGPHGSKYQALAAQYNVISPDFQGVLDLETRLQIAEATLRHHPDAIVVGSSFGGLVAAILAQQFPLKGLLLCAPALHLPEADRIHSLPANTLIVHGSQDDVVPLAASEKAAAQFGALLLTIEDDHRLKTVNTRLCYLVDQIARQA